MPNIDPTVLTTQQLEKAIECTQEIFETKLDGYQNVLETRLTGMDKAIELLQRSTDKTPDHIKDAVDRLERLHSEKFGSIATQFVERDKRTEQLSIADKTAIAAALQAQKEAAGATNESNLQATTKMEANFTKLIEKTQDLVTAVQRNTDEKINDVKSRLDKGDGQTSVSDPAVAHAINQLIGEVKELKTTGNKIEGKGDNSVIILSAILGLGLFVSIAIGIVGIFLAVKY